MMLKLSLFLENIGLIKKSEIAIDGLTVITGKNDSGKTTVGKALYSLVEGTADIEAKFDSDFKNHLRKGFNKVASILKKEGYAICSTENNKELCSLCHADIDVASIADIDSFIRLLEEQIRDMKYEEQKHLPADSFYEESFFYDTGKGDGLRINKALEYLEKIKEELHSPVYELRNYIRQSIIETLDAEFSSQILPVFHPEIQEGRIRLSGEDVAYYDICFSKEGGRADKVGYYLNPFKNVFFIDDPFVLENEKTKDNAAFISLYSRAWTHREKLVNELKNIGKDISIFDRMALDGRYKEISGIMDGVLPGRFESDYYGLHYVKDGKKLGYGNLAAGSKLFSLLKMLISMGKITEETLLILDEPETHLHPEWINTIAEIIVLLASNIGCRIVLTTQSANLVLALDAMSKKHGLSDQSSFYQTVRLEDSLVTHEDVSSCMNRIYSDHVKYLSEMKNLYDSLDGTAEE